MTRYEMTEDEIAEDRIANEVIELLHYLTENLRELEGDHSVWDELDRNITILNRVADKMRDLQCEALKITMREN